MCEIEEISYLNINELDDDVLLIIFSLLDFTDKVRIERVCRRWRDLVNYLFSKQTCLYFSDKNDFDVDLCCPDAKNNVKSTELIELFKLITLDFLVVLGYNEISRYDEMGEDIMNAAIKKCPNLKKIGLIDYLRLESPLRLICDNCHQSLESIDLIGFRKISITVSEMKRIGEKYPNLNYIRAVSSSLAIAEESLKALFENCLNLKHFIMHSNIVYPPSWTDWGRSGQYHRISGECYGFLSDKIREISTDIRILDNSGLLSLAGGRGGQNLTSLNLSGGTWDSWWIQIICQGLPRLQRLRCSKISVFSQDDLEDIALISELSDLRELFLDISSKSCVLYLDDALYGIMQGCPHMQKLQLFNAFITDRSLTHINNFWPNLYHLSFHTQMNPNITDESVGSIAKLKHLQYLNLNGTNVGDSIIDVILLCNKLKDINLEYTLVTNLTIEALIKNAISRPFDKITADLGGTDTEIQAYSLPSNLKIYR
jgi:hypothetical protein